MVKQTIVMVGAGLAAFLTAFSLHFFTKHPAYGGRSLLGDDEIRIITGVVFFVILLLFDREIFKSSETPPYRPLIGPDAFKPKATPQETSDEMAQIFSGVTDEASRRRAIWDWILSVPQLTVLIPFIFYLRFGYIGPLGWGLTVFFEVYCLLWVIGLYFRPRTEYHTPVRLKGDWVDRIGAFWLVGCAFGPFFGWTVTEFFTLTPNSWPWVYGLRVFLAAGVPILLALPLLRYVRGKSTRVALPLLVIVTLIPASTAMRASQDLWDGPTLQHGELYLKHTDRWIEAGH